MWRHESAGRIAALLDRGPRERRCFTGLAVLLVILRCAVFIVQGHIDFDADQAVIGLMAKHLSEFRTFPLFFYGQNYMLGAESWIVAPFFWVARPSIAVLKFPLLLLNLLAAVLLMRGVSRSLGVRPAIGFVAALPFIMPAPLVAANFMESGSTGVEPLLYVLILWLLRDRAFAFGAVLGFGFVHREFTLYALPALAIVELAGGTLLSTGTARRAAHGAAGFALAWLILDDAKMHLSGSSLFLEAQQMGKFACLAGLGMLDRARYMVTTIWPVLIGGTRVPLAQTTVRSSAVVGSDAIGWLVSGTLLLMAGRVVWLWLRRRTERPIGFAAYLALIGCCTLAAYTLTCGFNFPIVRYFSLAVLIPIGCLAAFAAWEPSARLTQAAIVGFVLWGAANLADNVRVIREAIVHPQPNPHAELTEFLLSHHIRYARAGYWDAYVVDFLSRERVIVGSNAKVRIPDYERRVNEQYAAIIERMPCDGQWHVASFCVSVPASPP